MKNIKKYLVSFGTLIVALFLGLQMAFAQTPLPAVEYSEDYRNKINHVFENLNLKYVPNWLLADYAFSFAKLSYYTGTPTDSSYVTMQTLRRIYATLQTAKVNDVAQIGTIAGFNSSVQAESQRVGDNGKDAVALISILYQYGRLKPTAITDGLLTVSNGQLFNAYPTVYSTCYEKQLLFALSPTKNIFKTKNIRFTLTEVDWSNLSGMSYEIDFGDGQGFRSLPRLQQFAINYPTAGLKTLVSRVTLSDGTQAESKSHIWIQTTPIASRIIANGTNPAEVLRLPENPDNIVPITATRAYQGVFGRANIEIALSDDNVLDHPLIVIEGFDASRWVDIEDYNYVRFRRAINTDIPAFFLEDGLTTTRNYDIVFVNFADGTDFIQRNAYVVQEVIRWVNRNKVNNPTTGLRETNVVLGESMGGLVGRYALAEMERPTDRRPSENHEVCQFYSHDSPHQGAYAPVAGEAALHHVASLGIGVGIPSVISVGINFIDIVPELRGVWNMAYSPAAQQMKKETVVSVFHQSYHLASNAHQEFMNEYNQLGYPTRCRNISISNGSNQGAAMPSPIGQYDENGTYFGQRSR